MSTRTGSGPDRRQRWRRVRLLRPLLRSTTLIAVVTAAYYVLALARDSTVGTTTVLILGLLGIGVQVAWQTVTIGSSRLPGCAPLRPGPPLCHYSWCCSSATYCLSALSARQGGAGPFSEPLNRTDAMSFSVAALTTAGFGDIAPVSQTAVQLGLKQRRPSSAPEQRDA
ncbi:hypothetical protein [Streptomyces sp. NPDC017993]|uniref:hypothetical protein n=1 Tax=Streptomyces sp. NPDC017993 TaxID=3365027 RepID=UPI003793E6CE